MNCLLIGGTGYLGQQLYNYLSNAHNLYYTIHNNDPYQTQNGVEISRVTHDFLTANNIQIIINLSNVYSRSPFSLKQVLDANVISPLRIYSESLDIETIKWINVSTTLPQWTNYYALCKNIFSEFIKLESQYSSFKFINLKTEMFYGPKQPDTNFIPMIFKKLIKNENIDLTSGKQIRDILRVEDVLRAIDCAIKLDVSTYKEYHISSKDRHSIKETVEYMKELTNSKSILNFGAIPDRDEYDYSPTCDDVRELQFSPYYSWKNGLKEYVKLELESNE